MLSIKEVTFDITKEKLEITLPKKENEWGLRSAYNENW